MDIPPPKSAPPIFVETPRQMEKVQQLAQAGRLEAVQSTRDVETVHRAMRQEQRRAEVAATPPPPPDTIPARIEVVDVTKEWPLDNNSVDLIVTSPPYGIDIDYAVGDVNPEEWFNFMQIWLGEAYRVTRPTGRLCLNIPLDTNKGGWRPTYADAVQAATPGGWGDWKYRCSIVWNEGNVSRSIARGSVDSHAAVNVVAPVEMIAVFYKNEWHREDGNAADIPHEDWLSWTNGLWTFNGESRAHDGHPAAFPEELPRRLILLFSGRGATVLDPFNGSGTTTLVAHKLGRRAIGFDKDPAWVASAQRRLADYLKEVPRA